MGKCAVKGHKYHVARVVGIYVNEENSYIELLSFPSQKLFNESYFDLVTAIPMNIIALHEFMSRNKLELLLDGIGNVLNMILLFSYIPMVMIFVVYNHYLVHHNYSDIHNIRI